MFYPSYRMPDSCLDWLWIAVARKAETVAAETKMRTEVVAAVSAVAGVVDAVAVDAGAVAAAVAVEQVALAAVVVSQLKKAEKYLAGGKK